MVVSYASDVATVTSSLAIIKLLWRWKGSIYKVVWRDFAIFALAYYLLTCLYVFVLKGDAKKLFERIAVYCDSFSHTIPVAFVLGFYVSLVLSRYWGQLWSLPWPHRLAVFVSAMVQGRDERSRKLRRTIVRYANLSWMMTMRDMCPPLEVQYKWKRIEAAGLITKSERKKLEVIEDQKMSSEYFVPLIWATNVVNVAYKEGRVKDPIARKTLIEELNSFRGSCGTLLMYDWVNIPLVYTQVVTIALYTFFLACLVGRQCLDTEHDGGAQHKGDLYFPLFTFLEFVFYMGWLKIAGHLMNPFGKDDNDIEITDALIEDNMKMTYAIVDEMSEKPMKISKDRWFGNPNIKMPSLERARSMDEFPEDGEDETSDDEREVPLH